MNLNNNQPLLKYPAKSGKMAEEYLPPEFNWLQLKIRRGYLWIRHILRRDIYYWHAFYVLSPVERKREDIKFIKHVEQEHDGKPEIKAEKWHYEKMKFLYENELNYIRSQLKLDAPTVRGRRMNTLGHPYALGYKKRWLDTKKWVPEEKMLYHGVTPADWLDVMEMISKARKKQAASDMKYFKNRLDKIEIEKSAPKEEPSKQATIKDLDTIENKIKHPVLTSYAAFVITVTLGLAFVNKDNVPFLQTAAASLVVAIFAGAIFFVFWGFSKLIKKIFGKA